MRDFFMAGGWGMYPTMVFGFCLFAAVGLDAVRRDARSQRVALLFGIVTLCAGLLGTCCGVCKTFDYLGQVPPEKQLEIAAAGVQESLHDLILALIMIVIAGLIGVAGAARRRSELASVPVP